jgi:hypothetical protein
MLKRKSSISENNGNNNKENTNAGITSELSPGDLNKRYDAIKDEDKKRLAVKQPRSRRFFSNSDKQKYLGPFMCEDANNLTPSQIVKQSRYTDKQIDTIKNTYHCKNIDIRKFTEGSIKSFSFYKRKSGSNPFLSKNKQELSRTNFSIPAEKTKVVHYLYPKASEESPKNNYQFKQLF